MKNLIFENIFVKLFLLFLILSGLGIGGLVVYANYYKEEIQEEEVEEIQEEELFKLNLAEDFTSMAEDRLENLFTSIQSSDLTLFNSFLIEPNEQVFNDISSIQHITYNLNKVNNVKFLAAKEDSEVKTGKYLVGELQLQMQNCPSAALINIIYDNSNEEIYFDETVSNISNLCILNCVSDRGNLDCIDYFYAPVDKHNSLPSTYAPNVVATGLSGGGSLVPEAVEAMKLMFNDAASQGIQISLISTYRSYATQQGTFNYWVNKEIAAGYSRVEAEIRANNYSAKPGHSEHQLGTAADLKCNGCASFDNSQGNLAVYNYLEENAHKFGFVISYPENSEEVTGYVYEPWHIRYVGEKIATELFEDNYLSSGEYLLRDYLQSIVKN